MTSECRHGKFPSLQKVRFICSHVTVISSGKVSYLYKTKYSSSFPSQNRKWRLQSPMGFSPLLIPTSSRLLQSSKVKQAHLFPSLVGTLLGVWVSREVCWKRLIPRKRVWLRMQVWVGGTGKPMGGATTDPAATLWGIGLRLWLTKAHRGSDRDTGRNESLWCLHSQDIVPQIFLFCCSKRDHPPTSMSLEKLRLHLASVFQGLCSGKFGRANKFGIQRLSSRFKTDSSWCDNSSTNMYWKLNTRFHSQ